MGYLAKLNADGHVMWCTMLSGADIGDHQPLRIGSSINDLVERNGEYWAVGRTSYPGGSGMVPFVVRVSSSGVRLDHELYTMGQANTTLPLDWPQEPEGWFTQIASDPATDRLLITGYFNTPMVPERAIALVLEPGADPFQPTWFRFTGNTYELEFTGVHHTTSPHYTTGGGFVTTDGVTRIIWPIISNYEIGYPASGPHSATLFVHGFGPSGAFEWTTSLGEVRAYDLQSDICQMADGNLAVVSSKWARGYSLGGEHVSYATLPSTTQTCLDADFGYTEGVAPIIWNMETWLFNYWNTDPFVAKLNAATGVPIGAAQWDADPSTTFECSYGDLRDQECVYKITEAGDGGWVVSGNTSHNFDDMYLTKIKPGCQSALAYEPLPLNTQGKYELQTNETWNTDRNIYGTIVVPDGKTLTINNSAVIRFADTQKLYWPTRIEVEAGGTLFMNDNAVLAAVEGCPDALWDGVLIKGDGLASQFTTGAQGRALLEYCTIAQSRVGTLAANEFAMGPMSPEDPSQFSGGIIIANEVTYRNNVYDVAFSEYENFTPNHPYYQVRQNVSTFTKCHFLNGGDLNYPGPAAKDHVLLNFVRGIVFDGCDWDVDLTTTEYADIKQLGTGIHSINSTFSVIDFCISDPGPYGCGNQLHSRFGNLNRAIVATTFDPSRTFKVDGAVFDKNNMGIYMSGIQDQMITRCAFDVAEPQVPGLIFVPYALYGDQCTGYTIQENSFTTTEPEGHVKVGAIISNSGKAPNLIYNNSYDKLFAAQLVEGNNRYTNIINPGNPYQGQGLEIRCNDFGQTATNKYDVALTGTLPTIAKQQGRNAVQSGGAPDPTKPAGNVFSDNCINPEGDYYVEDLGTEYIQYWYHESSVYHTQPICYNFIEPSSAFALYVSKEQACPTHLGKDGPTHLSEAHEGKEGFDSAQEAYDATKDNGNSAGLVAYLENPANSTTAKRNALLSVAPKASLESLKAAFNSDPALSDWHLTQSLVANSPLDGEALQWTYTSGLDPFFINLVDGAQTGEVNLLTVLQMEMAQFSQEKAEALYGLGQDAWLKATETGEALDSLLVWTARYAPENAKATEAGVLGAKGAFNALELLAANEELSSLEPEKFTVLKLWAQAEQANGWQQPDQGTVNELQNIAQQTDVIGSAHAAAWLHALGEELAPEVIVLPDMTKSSNQNRNSTSVRARTEAVPLELLEAYPNPTAGAQWVVYSLPEASEHASLLVQDALGRLVVTRSVNNKNGILEFNTTSWSAGAYTAQLVLDGIQMGQLKLIVQR